MTETAPPVGDDLNEKRIAQRLEEYKFLREELHSIGAEVHSVFNFMLALIGLIVAAAYNTKGDSLVLLPFASIISLGAYNLLRVQTIRSWRLVGYMRRELEPGLQGVRWETRLHAWREVNGSLETRRLFDEQFRILNWINWGLVLALFFGPWTFIVLPHDKNLTEEPPLKIQGNPILLSGQPVGASAPVSMALALLPLNAIWSQRKHRREGLEKTHLHAWEKKYIQKGEDIAVELCKLEPPGTWSHPKQHHSEHKEGDEPV
jgi:hypothetical protein